jgi:acyl-CoA reductase-like NAD-dependent aldehyde dehydrogenase
MTFLIRNPRTGQTEGTFEGTSPAEVRTVIESVRRAQREWEGAGVVARAKGLQIFVDKLNDRAWRDKLVEALVADTGRRSESLTEISGLSSTLQRWISYAFENAGLWQAESTLPTAIPNFTQQCVRDAVPVVGVISPWNFPLLLSFVDTVPALLAGSGVVIKPSEVTPRWALVMKELLDSVPVLGTLCRIVEGGAQTGEAVVDGVDTVCFTGSVGVGRKVAVRAAERLIPAHLELGGKDAALVFADADLESAVRSLLWGCTANAGQSCLSIERIYVHENVYPQFIHMMREQIEGLILRSPVSEWMAPVISSAQVAVIEAHLNDAKARGACIETGGRWEDAPQGVHIMAPTLMTSVHHGMKVMTEESFAPFIPVMPFKTESEAVGLANDSHYGLSAAVFSADASTLKRVSDALEASAVSLNDCGLTAFLHQCAKTPRKESGAGLSRMGADGLLRFMRKKAVLKKSAAEQADPWWYPHSSVSRD